MLSRIAKFLLVSALMISIGAQWAVLQSAAWIGMAVTYSISSGSMSEGLSEAFDGQHPCKLCCAIKKGQQHEKKDTKFDTLKKLELFVGKSGGIVLFAPLPTDELPRAADETAAPRCTAPPTPPPRCGLA